MQISVSTVVGVLATLVALRKESVDRNLLFPLAVGSLTTSLSARRAWIEISGGACARPLAAWSLSARRAWIEIAWVQEFPQLYSSLSARRAWIEMLKASKTGGSGQVALRKESVDRNYWSFC